MLTTSNLPPTKSAQEVSRESLEFLLLKPDHSVLKTFSSKRISNSQSYNFSAKTDSSLLVTAFTKRLIMLWLFYILEKLLYQRLVALIVLVHTKKFTSTNLQGIVSTFLWVIVAAKSQFAYKVLMVLCFFCNKISRYFRSNYLTI